MSLRHVHTRTWLALATVAMLTACASGPAPKSNDGVYRPDLKDSGPSGMMDVSHIPDAVPRYEPRTIAGNKTPYSVLGKTYKILDNADFFTQNGYASWYGRKFHGRRTSNGELYDMYGMTAAHKTLPIPSYVRVTNQSNGKSVVVRVNDRGPFHSDRVIDLTYAAAAKLGFANKGTAPVRVEVIMAAGSTVVNNGGASSSGSGVTVGKVDSSSFDSGQAVASEPLESMAGAPRAPAPKNSSGFQLPNNSFLQAGAFSSEVAATKVGEQLARLTEYPVNVRRFENEQLYRIHIGPISDNWELTQLRDLLQKNQFPSHPVVYD